MLRLPSPGLPATELPASDEGHSQFPQEPQGGDGSGSGDEGDEGEGVFWDSTMGFGEPCSPPQIWGPGRIFLSLEFFSKHPGQANPRILVHGGMECSSAEDNSL